VTSVCGFKWWLWFVPALACVCCLAHLSGDVQCTNLIQPPDAALAAGR
jgi:hypothetical protein